MTGFLGGSLIGVGQGGAINTGDIEHSLRFRGAQYLSKNLPGPSNRNKLTVSVWVKRGKLGAYQGIVWAGADASSQDIIRFSDDDRLEYYSFSGSERGRILSVARFRDPTAVLHVVLTFDFDNAVAAERVKMWVDGVSQAYTVTNVVTQGSVHHINATSAHRIGSQYGATYIDAYISRLCWVDNLVVTDASDFGEFNPTINEWVSKTQAEVKAVVDAGGANSFMLDFDDGTSLTTLGYDKSSKGNNWTLNGFSLTPGATYAWMDDVPGNSYATWNPLNSTVMPIFNANLTATGSGTQTSTMATVTVDSGKWYWEITKNSLTGLEGFGISKENVALSTFSGHPGGYAYAQNGNKYNNGVGAAYGPTLANNDVVVVALDLAAGTIKFYKNSVDLGIAYSGLSGNYTPAAGSLSPANDVGYHVNFGQRPLIDPALQATLEADGFKALCQANLAADGTVITSGTFSGNAVADGPCVWMNGCPDTLTINGNAVTFGTHADRLATGFKIRTSSASYNTAGSNAWTATISSDLENIFKYNNAKDNS